MSTILAPPSGNDVSAAGNPQRFSEKGRYGKKVGNSSYGSSKGHMEKSAAKQAGFFKWRRKQAD